VDPWAECLQGFLREHLASPGGAFGGGLPGDEEELRFIKDVDKEPTASKVGLDIKLEAGRVK
jgi:hypothetical protein